MPFIHVEFLEGKTLEQKRDIAKAITDAMVNIGGAKPETVYVIFNDLAKSNLAKGGQLFVDKQ